MICHIEFANNLSVISFPLRLYTYLYISAPTFYNWVISNGCFTAAFAAFCATARSSSVIPFGRY